MTMMVAAQSIIASPISPVPWISSPTLKLPNSEGYASSSPLMRVQSPAKLRRQYYRPAQAVLTPLQGGSAAAPLLQGEESSPPPLPSQSSVAAEEESDPRLQLHDSLVTAAARLDNDGPLNGEAYHEDHGPLSALPPRLANNFSQMSSLILNVLNDAKLKMVTSIVDLLFKPSDDVNITFQGNFAPVMEIGGRVLLKIIEGSIPMDFPIGAYIRNGSNPRFGGPLTSPFGKTLLHWFEGDGMLHATYFGPNGHVTYENKFIETEGYKIEKKAGRRLWLNALEGDPKAIAMGFFFNQIMFGKVNKATCNTSIFQHAGRVYVVAEGDLPYEIDPSNLKTLKAQDWNGEWDRPFTSHPKVIRDTNEMVTFGFSAKRPYQIVAVVSADGEKIIHKCDLGLEKATLSHEIGITDKYNIILDWPLTLNVDRLMQGGDFMRFEHDIDARVGIMPRFGSSKDIKWFVVERNFTFHVINSYEEGDEVVLQGCRARIPLLYSTLKKDKVEWFARAITPTKVNVAKDHLVDGALISQAHEWRFNMKTGVVRERHLTNDTMSMEMPKINDTFVGYKNQYAYASIVDLHASKLVGMPKYGKLVKLYLDEKIEDDCVKLEFYDPGENKYISEPLFVPKPNSQNEDDGWIVTYVHDESKDASEVHILAADNFCGKPLARIQLPQRVPYGFHSTFVQGIL